MKGRGEDVTVTLRCNNACSFCPRPRLADVRVPRRSLARVLRKVRDGGETVVLSGGEATLLPDFFDIVARCRSLGFTRIGLVTNGRRASRADFAARLLSAGLRDIMLSVYSHLPAVHDGMTGVPGSCRETWRGLANLLVLSRGLAVCPVRVNLLTTSANAASLLGTLRRLARLGVPDVLVMDVLSTDGRILPPYAAIRRAWAALGRDRGLSGMRVRFRGYPPCLFARKRGAGAARPPGGWLSYEPMDLDTTLGSDPGALARYLGDAAKLFTKDAPPCGRCRLARRCPGVQRSYLRRYGGKDLG